MPRSVSIRVTAIAMQSVLLSALTVVPAGAQKNKQRAQEQQEFLKQQLLNQTFETKIPIGNCQGGRLFASGNLKEFQTDTEIRPDLTINYLRRVVLSFGGAGTQCLEGESREGVVIEMPRGTMVVVGGIEMKDNRFELALRGPNNAYGRLKFFYGGAYASDSAPLVLLIYVSKVLRLKAFERIEQARQQYRNLVWELASAYDKSRFQVPPQPNDEESFRRLVQDITGQLNRPQPDNPRPASEQLKRLHATEAILQKILHNREEYLAAVQGVQEAGLFEPVDREIWQQAGEGIRARLVELEARAREERRLELRGSLAEKRRKYETERGRLPKSASRGFDELKSAIEQDDKCLSLLDQRLSLLNELAKLGEAQTSSEVAEIEGEQVRLQQLRQQWEAQRKPLELAKLNDEYVELRLRVNRTPVYQRRPLLEQLLANRERAALLGDARARERAEQIKREIASLP